MITVIVPGVALDAVARTLYVDPPVACKALGINYEPCDHYLLGADIMTALQMHYDFPELQLQVLREGEGFYVEELKEWEGTDK